MFGSVIEDVATQFSTVCNMVCDMGAKSCESVVPNSSSRSYDYANHLTIDGLTLGDNMINDYKTMLSQISHVCLTLRMLSYCQSKLGDAGNLKFSDIVKHRREYKTADTY